MKNNNTDDKQTANIGTNEIKSSAVFFNGN